MLHSLFQIKTRQNVPAGAVEYTAICEGLIGASALAAIQKEAQ